MFLRPALDQADETAGHGDTAHAEDEGAVQGDGRGDTANHGEAKETNSASASHGDSGASADHGAPAKGGHGEPASGEEFVRLTKQFVIPVMTDERVSAMVVLSISIATDTGLSETIYHHEPRLRDEILRVLFRHANSGGFNGVFTSGRAMDDLRSALNIAVHSVLGEIPAEALVTEIMRQDV